MNSTVEVTRRQLYDEVWSEPISKLSKKYGLSDVGLAKVCKRNGIPRPGNGMWSKLKHGHKVKKTPLPELPDEKPIQFNISIKGIGREDPALPKEAEALIAFEQREENRIVVPEKLLKPLPCIKNVRAELLSAEVAWDGLLHTDSLPRIMVTKPLIPRALRVMDTLAKALQSRGYLKERMEIFEQPVAFGICEYLQSVRTERAIAEERGRGTPGGYSTRDYKRIPSGRLKLVIWSRFTFCGHGIQRNWIDGKNQRIEDCLNDFICGLVRWAAVGREKTLQWERRDREREEEERIHQEEAQQEAEKKARIDRLYQDADNWSQANQLRDYIAAVVEKKALNKSNGALLEWEKWARAEADRIDPLCST